MWRNRKIGGKLSLGFGLVVLVFLVSVFVMWRSIITVQAASRLLAGGVAVASEQVNGMNGMAYEVFLAMRQFQYREDEASLESYRTTLEKLRPMENAILQLNRDQPMLAAPAHVVKVVLPMAQQYGSISEANVNAIRKKQTQLAAIRKTGQDTSAVATEFMNVLNQNMKNMIQRGATQFELSNMADSLAKGDALREECMAMRRDMWQFIATFGNDSAVTKAIADRLQLMGQQINELGALAASMPEVKDEIDRMGAGVAAYQTQLNEFIKTCSEVNRLNEERAPVMSSLNGELTAAANIANTRLKEVSLQNEAGLSSALNMMFLSTGVAIILAIVIVFFISREITAPLHRIVSLSERIKDGNLTIRKDDFRYESADEMGQMVSALAAMVESQSDAMKDIVSTGSQLAAVAGELASYSEETNVAMKVIKTSIAEVTVLSESNGSALEESNAGVEEMSAGADTVAQSATDSAAFISQTTEASNKAVQTVNNVIAGMRNVDKNSKESEEKTRQLVSSVENVSSFVSVITGIADQTNLLALNAAIEAARAGEVGRGFAVVAEEVRKLAEESARAAQNVNGIIQELQTGARASIEATSEAGRLLVTTLDHAEQALQELNGALSQMQKANDSIQNIAAVAEEQAASSREVALAIDTATKSSIEMVTSIGDIDKATNNTSDATTNVSRLAGKSLQEVHSLLRGISNFRVLTDAQLADEILGKIQSHKDFARQLYKVAETCEPQILQTSANLCGLGILMSSSLPPRGYEHWWDKITPVHEEFHELGAEILKVIGDGKKSLAEKRTEATSLARKGETLSKTIIKLLEDAASDIRTAREVTRAKAQQRSGRQKSLALVKK